MNNYTLAIYFSPDGAFSAPFNSPAHFHNYSYLMSTLKANNINVVVVRNDSYISSGYFSNFFVINSATSVTHHNATIKVDLILNRDQSNTIPDIYDCPIINNMDFDILCTDKLQTYHKLPEHHPKTFLVHSFEQFKALDVGEMVVLKPNEGNCGGGIIIDKTDKIQENSISNWNNYIVQEFMDTSVGIDGIVDSAHDIRLILIKDKPVFCLVRTPPPGSLISNISIGGRGIEVDIEDLPTDLLALTEDITSKLDHMSPFFWSIDFANTPDGYKIIELNSHPGISSTNLTRVFTHALLQEIMELKTNSGNNNLNQ